MSLPKTALKNLTHFIKKKNQYLITSLSMVYVPENHAISGPRATCQQRFQRNGYCIATFI